MIYYNVDQEKQSCEATTCAAEAAEVHSLVHGGGDATPVAADVEECLSIVAAVEPSIPVSTSEWRTSVKVNKEAGARTSASSDEDGWVPSVKVNKEAGSHMSASTDEGGWKASVKVNKGAGNRSSASTDDGTWRDSVKVNKQAGNRSSDVFNDSTSINVVSRKTGVRILNEPGGSGAAMYGTLYGESDELHTPKESFQPNGGDNSASSTDDVEMEDVVDPTNVATPREPLPGATEDEDVQMQDTVHDVEESASWRSDWDEELSSKASGALGVAPEPVKSTRVSLPPVHPFFSMTIPEDDSEMLTRALIEVTCTQLLPVAMLPDINVMLTLLGFTT